MLLLLTSQVSGYMAVERVFHASSELRLASEVTTRTVIALALGARIACDGWTSTFIVLHLRSIRNSVKFEALVTCPEFTLFISQMMTFYRRDRSIFGELILWTFGVS